MSNAGGEAVTVLAAAVVAASVCAMVGWVLAATHARSVDCGARTAVSPAYSQVGLVVVVATSVVGVVVAPVIGVFWLWVALNHLLGTGEQVPFSRYPMFAEPHESSWTLRYETSAGAPLNIVNLGIQPTAARKRFLAEQLAAQAETRDLSISRRRAADVIADWIRARRPGSGPLSSEPITIVLMEYSFDGETITSGRTVLTVVAPP